MANLSNINNKFLVTTGGNVLIGKTAANNATVGTQIMSTGDINPTVSGDTVARFNRLGTDGEIIRFQHDTLTDGAINSLSGRIAIGSGTTGVFFDSIRDVLTPHNMTTNAYSSNISLGRDLIRFKDIYLSGKVVAGTGSTAAATINAYSTTVSAGLHSALRIIENTGASSYWDIGATNGASTILNFYHNAATTPKITFTHTGGATFAGNVTATGRLTVNTGGGIAAYFNGNGSNYTQGAITLQSSNESTPEVRGQGVFMYNQGTDTTWYTGTTYNNADRFIIGRATNASLNTEAARADNAFVTVLNSGNVGIGTTTVQNKFVVRDTGSGFNSTIQTSTVSIISKEMTDNAYHSILQLVAVRQSLTTGNASNGYLGFSTVDDSNNQGQLDAGRIAIVNEAGSSRNSATALSFWTNPGGTQTTAATEKMRINSAGFLKASNNGSYDNATSTVHELVSNSNGGQIAKFTHKGTVPYGLQIRYSQVAPNITDNYFFLCSDSSANRLIIWGNGNVQNQNNSYGAISDARLKENIVDATPKLNDLMKVKIRNFNLIGDDNKQIGVIAQEIEKVFPSLVENTKEKNSEEITKSVKYSVFVPMLIKAIQELKAEIELLKSK